MKTNNEMMEEAMQRQDKAKYKPDLSYYARLDGLTLVEFALVLHEINPEIYSRRALDVLFVAEVFKPESLYVSEYFMEALEAARKDYILLKRVQWMNKYGDCYRMVDNTFLIDVLVKEALEKGLKIPAEFIKFYEQRAAQLKQVNKNVSENKASPSQEARARNTLLKVIAAMARSGYGRKDLLMPVGFSQELECDTQKNGHAVSDATILNILKEANEYMNLPEEDS